MDFGSIVKHFAIDGEFVGGEPYGNGHINTTYTINYIINGSPVRFILQKINTNVFPDADKLMENISKVTAYMRDIIIKEGGDPQKGTLNLINTTDGKPFYKAEDGSCYRVYVFVEDTVALQIVEDAKVFEGAGRAFGSFINKLDGFPAEELHEVIENFHNTESRFINFAKSLDIDYKDRSISVAKEIEFVLNRKQYCSEVVSKLKSGALPLRVTHNDTKLNNVLLDDKTGEPVCVIDLDTIMPGSLLYDFGDAIRSGCNTGLEDEPDLKKVGFDIKLFESFVKGFMEGLGSCITPVERDMLAFGAILMTFECGMRFLTDYLSGDTYFKIHYDEHNIVRARTQFKMVEDMEKCLDKMNAIVRKYSKV